MTRFDPAALLTLALLPLTACLEKEPDDDDDDTGEAWSDDTGVQCGSTQGFVYGTVSGPYSSDPNGAAIVRAYDPGADTTVEAEHDGSGNYELNLEGGSEYILYAEYDYCYSGDYSVTVDECEEYQVDIVIEDCDVADKPNLYLYPDGDTEMAVRVSHGRKQQIVASDPPHGELGWAGIAHPDGTFTQDGERAPFLFYEVSLAPWQGRHLQRDAGWCVKAEGAVEAMADILALYDFNAREVDDFVDAWTHDLPPAAAYTVYPQRDVDYMAQLKLDPDLPIDRLWLLVEEGSGCAPLFEPVVEPMDRRGAHGVEWGVILHGLGR
jgi:hypothetical protein